MGRIPRSQGLDGRERASSWKRASPLKDASSSYKRSLPSGCRLEGRSDDDGSEGDRSDEKAQPSPPAEMLQRS